MNPFIRLIYALLIAGATVAFVGVSIYTFYPAPQPPTYPQQIMPLEKGINQPLGSPASGGIDEYQQAYERYQAELKTYYRNVSIIVSVVAIVMVAGGMYLRRRADIIGEGLSLGGVGSTIYGVVTASMADDRVMRFVAVTLFLAAAILVVHTEFSSKAAASEKAPAKRR